MPYLSNYRCELHFKHLSTTMCCIYILLTFYYLKSQMRPENEGLPREGTDDRIHRYPKVLSLVVISVFQVRLLEVIYDGAMDPRSVRPLHYYEICRSLETCYQNWCRARKICNKERECRPHIRIFNVHNRPI